jgi:hypothetical protein
MATVNRSTIECPQRVVDRRAQVAELEATEKFYRDLVDPADPDGTVACAYEAHRLRRIAVALRQR